jgi:hypothetical protein
MSMPRPTDLAEDRLERLLGLTASEAKRAVEEMVDCFRFGVDEYVAKRHDELKARGASNEEIYNLIAAELKTQRFMAPALSRRQIRRRVYG